jgi:FHS family Na+ dependent glucose MFS transporter 1
LTSQSVNPRAATAAYFLALVILGLMAGITGPTLPALAEQTTSRLDQVAAIFVSVSFGYMLASFIGGRIYDRIPGHRLMAAATLIVAACSVLIPIVPALWMLVAVLFVSGIAQGLLDVGGNTLLTWVHGSRVAPYMNFLHFCFGVGALAAPIAVDWAVRVDGSIRWAYWAFALVMLPVALLFWLQPSPGIRHEGQARRGRVASPVLLGLIVSFFFVYAGSELGYGNWIFTYTTTLGLTSESAARYLTSAFWGFFTAGRLAGVFISTRVKPIAVLGMDLAGCVLGIGLILARGDSPVFMWIGTGLLGLSTASVFPAMMNLAEERLGLTGTVTGWFLLGTGAGGMFWPWLIGQIFVKAGPHAMMFAVGTAILLNLLQVAVLAGFRRPTPAAEVAE